MNKKSIFYILFCVIIIDAMGMALPFPVLGTLIMSTQSFMLDATVSTHVREILYGLVMSSFTLGMFIGCPILGDISDKIGRKKGLLCCLMGAAVGNIISAMGVIEHSMTLLIVGRFLAGFACGSQPIAQAAIIDMSTEAERTIHLSRIVLAVTLGIVIGPLMGGIGSNAYCLQHVGLSLPFWLVTGITLINALALYYFYQEIFIPKENTRISFFKGFVSFLGAFNNKSMALLSLCFFLFQLAWSLYFNGIALFMINEYHYSPLNIGLFIACLGAGASIGMTVGIRLIMKYLKQDKLSLIFSIAAMAATLFFVTIVPSAIGQWICVFSIAIFVSIAYTNALTLYSQQVSDAHQGWIMGVAMSVANCAWVLASSFLGELAFTAIRLPFWVGFISATISLLILIFF